MQGNEIKRIFSLAEILRLLGTSVLSHFVEVKFCAQTSFSRTESPIRQQTGPRIVRNEDSGLSALTRSLD